MAAPSVRSGSEAEIQTDPLPYAKNLLPRIGYMFYVCSQPMTPNPTPFLDRVTGFFARVIDRIAGFGDPAGRDRAGCEQVGGEPVGRDQAGRDQAGLDPAQAGALLARLRHLLARFRAVAAAPVPPPRPEPKPAEPRFVPAHRFRDLSADGLPDPTPEPNRLPRARGWLSRLVPQAEAERAHLEEMLADPATQAQLAADPRLGRLLRPLGWMLGVERALLPPSRWRRRQLILVPGERAEGRWPNTPPRGRRGKPRRR